jgi:hypothetical protein
MWESFWDPVAVSQGVLTFLLYARGDVREGGRGVNLVFSEKALNEKLKFKDALNAGQSRLALVAKTALELSDTPSSEKKFTESGNIRIPVALGSEVIDNTQGFSEIKDSSKGLFSIEKTIEELKSIGILDKDNRSSGFYEFETSTGELYLDAKRSYMTINTPRFKGVCSKAGAKADMKILVIENMTTEGCISLAALDKGKSLDDSERMLLVYATNALNTGMTFADESMSVRKKYGTNPTLVKTGKFRIKLKNMNSSKLKVWPLAMNGARRLPLEAKANEDGYFELEINTAELPDGPALFFEIAVE